MAVAISEQISPRKRMLIFLDIMIAIIGITFLLTAMNIALPTMKEILGVSDSMGSG